MKKNVLVFGAGELQLSIIEKIKQRGYNAVVIDPSRNAYAKKSANIFEVVDGEDFDLTCKIVEKHKISAIITAATDKPLRMMAKIATKYGFSFFSEATAEISTDKFLMKNIFSLNHLPHADGALVNKNSSWYKFPCIIKPRDNSGSRGVIYCKNEKEFKNAMNESYNYTKLDTVLVEEYIEGKEYSVESLHYNGKVYVLQVTEKRTTEFPYNVELEHIQPSDLSVTFIETIEVLMSKIGNALGFKNCASHTEFKIDGRKIVIIETSPRLGGDYITSHLVQLSTGIDIEECLIDISLGVQPKHELINPKASAIVYLHFSTGRVKEIKDCVLPSSIVKFTCSLKPGTIISEIRNSTDRYGFFIISGESRENILNEIGLTVGIIKNSILIQ